MTLTPENEILLIAVLAQVSVVSLDYEALAKAIGAKGAPAARHRWDRLRKKLIGSESKPSPRKPTGITKKSTLSAKASFSSSSSFERGVKEEFGNEAIGRQLSPPVTPVRKLPGRKARVTSFKEFADEDMEERTRKGELVEVAGDGDVDEFWT